MLCIFAGLLGNYPFQNPISNVRDVLWTKFLEGENKGQAREEKVYGPLKTQPLALLSHSF